MSKLETWLDRIPAPKDDIIGWCVSWYLNRHDPESVKFKVHADDEDTVVGYSLAVKTKGEYVKESKEFFEEHIGPRLEGKQ